MVVFLTVRKKKLPVRNNVNRPKILSRIFFFLACDNIPGNGEGERRQEEAAVG